MAITQTAREERVLLQGVRWETYEQILADVEGRGLRFTYDRGRLEIMTVSPTHESWKQLVGRMLETVTLALGVPMRSGGGPTWKREDLAQGLEPDECYWVEHEEQVRHKTAIDLAVDPPPDLAIEVEVTRSALDRLHIYAGLGVSEVWRFDGERITVHLLRPDGSYALSTASEQFPWLPMAQFTEFLGRARETDETTWLNGLAAWARATLRP
jgi:Uma2 family endonuclease